MLKQKIFELLHNCNFTNLNLYNYQENVLDRLCQDQDYEIRHGVSKLVLIPKDDPYVIKIPFFSYIDDFDDEPYCFTNANTSSCYYWDYCCTETIIYHQAQKYNIERAFCKTRRIGTIKCHPIYIQEKGVTLQDILIDGNKNHLSSAEAKDQLFQKIDNDKINKEQKIKICNSHPVWTLDAFNYYDKKTFFRLMDFINKHIRDLHNDNIGYIGSKPVLIDYSGFSS